MNPNPTDLAPYDAGLLSDFGGGDVSWWHDYIRAELGRAHEHYTVQFQPFQPISDELAAAQARVAVLEEALYKIASGHFERVGYGETDIDIVPDMTAEQAMRAARAALTQGDWGK